MKPVGVEMYKRDLESKTMISAVVLMLLLSNMVFIPADGTSWLRIAWLACNVVMVIAATVGVVQARVRLDRSRREGSHRANGMRLPGAGRE